MTEREKEGLAIIQSVMFSNKKEKGDNEISNFHYFQSLQKAKRVYGGGIMKVFGLETWSFLLKEV